MLAPSAVVQIHSKKFKKMGGKSGDIKLIFGKS
jgi:hypothetical protein